MLFGNKNIKLNNQINILEQIIHGRTRTEYSFCVPDSCNLHSHITRDRT
jgi:hypothetical protein